MKTLKLICAEACIFVTLQLYEIPNPKFDLCFIVLVGVVVQHCRGCGALFPSSWVRRRRGWVVDVIVSLRLRPWRGVPHRTPSRPEVTCCVSVM